jgi:acetyltransferase-like isoleucine patch superfamily enzyme
LPGVTLSEGCVIGANSVVTKTTEPWTIYVGNPAKPTKKRNQGEIKNYSDKLKNKKI